MKINSNRIIAIVSTIGGIGTSFVTAGLGVNLAMLGKKVLLFDNSSSLVSISCLLGISDEILFDAADVVKGNCDLQEAIYHTPVNGLSVLECMNNPRDVLAMGVNAQLLDALSKQYDYVLIDAPKSFSYAFDCSIAGAHEVFVVSDTSKFSVESCSKLKRHINSIDDNKFSLILNKFSEDLFWNMAIYHDLDEVIDISELKLLGIIPKDDNITDCMYKGKAIYSNYESDAFSALARISRRLNGEQILLAYE